MKPAVVQSPSFVATLRSSFRSLFNNKVAVYLDQSEGSLSRWLSGSSFGKKPGFFFLFVFLPFLSFSQDTVSNQDASPAIAKRLDTSAAETPGPNKKRIALVTGINVGVYGGSLFILNRAWYKDEARTSFQVFNDTKEWLQIDKLGHAWTAYNAGRASTMLWEWAGLSHKKAVWIGGLSGFVYLTGIEFLDAHSAKWGWSWGDIGANIIGSGLFMGQEFLWKEQRIQYKFSFHKKNYNEPMLEERADELFGAGIYERMLKDYNAQTYWFSFNIKSFLPQSNLPAWLNIAVGYGADGMFGGFENKWKDEQGNDITRFDIPRKRQFYIAPDIDFTKIKTRSKFLKTSFALLNAFKCPAPALMIDNKGKFKAYAFYF